MAQQHPNIIYIMSNDHDANAISNYNATFIKKPNIDRIAKEGILFNRSFIGKSICGPATATILTGLHSHKNGFIDNRSRFGGDHEKQERHSRHTDFVKKYHF